MKDIAGHGKKELYETFEAMALYAKENKIKKDIYGKGEFVNSFEKELAQLAGFESALFLPSGVMAQVIAMKIYCEHARTNKFCAHPTSHLLLHENDSFKELTHLEKITYGEERKLPLIQDILEVHHDNAPVIYELPMRHLGGDAPELNEFIKLKNELKNKDIKLHIDGARVFELLPYYDVTLKELMKDVDSMFLSFYKGFGSTSGSMLLGSEDFIKEAKVWLRRFGGNLFDLSHLYVMAKMCFDQRKDNFKSYHEKAKSIVELLRSQSDLNIYPENIKSNMFHIDYDKNTKDLWPLLKDKAQLELNVGLWPKGDRSSLEFSVGDSTLDLSDQQIVDHLIF